MRRAYYSRMIARLLKRAFASGSRAGAMVHNLNHPVENLNQQVYAFGLTKKQLMARVKFNRIRRRFQNVSSDTIWEQLPWAFGEPDGYVDRTSTAKTAILKGSKT